MSIKFIYICDKPVIRYNLVQGRCYNFWSSAFTDFVWLTWDDDPGELKMSKQSFKEFIGNGVLRRITQDELIIKDIIE